MKRRYQQNQCNLIREHFREHPYFRLCKTVFDVFLDSHPTMILTPEQLFADASKTLDDILRTQDEEYCKSLWTNTYNMYREQDGTSCNIDDTKFEVAILFYSVMYALLAVNHSHYRGTLHRLLHQTIYKFFGNDKNLTGNRCIEIEKVLKPLVNKQTSEMLTWMEEYFVNVVSLTTEIDSLLHSSKPCKSKTKKDKNKSTLYTLYYNCNDKNLRTKRINFVRRKWEEWNWIETNTDIEDFEDFFDGKPRDCQLKWKANNAVLSLLIAELDKQYFITKQTGCSPRSVVINQFKRSYDKHTKRVDELDKLKIFWTIQLLDFKNSLALPQLPYRQGDDISDAALQEVFAGNLHITKDLNKS